MMINLKIFFREVQCISNFSCTLNVLSSFLFADLMWLAVAFLHCSTIENLSQ